MIFIFDVWHDAAFLCARGNNKSIKKVCEETEASELKLTSSCIGVLIVVIK
jgi:hypothetical protein